MFDTSRKTVIGMIHVGALPGTPRATDPIEAIIERAAAEAGALTAAGFDALLIENMHDAPYLNGTVGPEIVAAMTAVGLALCGAADIPIGVQVLAAANSEALAVALACGARFIRAENFAYAHVADEGLMPTASAGPLLRYRKQIGAEHVQVLADIKKKHASHALTADIDLAEAARTARICGADGVVVTGTATAAPTRPEDVAVVRKAVDLPVVVGSGITPEGLPALWPHADGFIVGSFLKQDGFWSNPLDPGRIERLMDSVRALRV